MKARPFYTNIHFLFLAGGLLLNLLLAMVYRYINAGSPWLGWQELPGFYTQGWPIMLQTFVILYVVYYAIRYFDKRYSQKPNGTERHLREGLFVLVTGLAVMEGLRRIFVTYMVVPEEDAAFLERKLKMILAIDIVFLFVVYGFFTAFRIFRYLQQKDLEIAEWQRGHMQSQFETARNNLNPHFLFNSLNALSSLVYADADRAERFIEKLSRSYRYLLEQRDKETVPLREELQFLEGFLFLTGERFGSKLEVEFAVGETKSYRLPPHTLMIVVDDILQRQRLSLAKPLRLEIRTDVGALLIRHSHQPKTGADTPSAALATLQAQLRYLNGEEMTTAVEPDFITLRIPLLPA